MNTFIAYEIVFKVVFHHFFSKAMDDIGRAIASRSAYSLEFEDGIPFTQVYVRFWKDSHLVRLQLCRFGSANQFPAGHLGTIARIMAMLSTRPDIVSCSGCPLTILKSLNQTAFFNKGVQYPFRFDGFAFRSLVHQSSGGIFGSVDFYSTLQFLIVFLGGAQQQSWLVEATALVKVSLSLCGPTSYLIFVSAIVVLFRAFQVVGWTLKLFLRCVRT